MALLNFTNDSSVRDWWFLHNHQDMVDKMLTNNAIKGTSLVKNFSAYGAILKPSSSNSVLQVIWITGPRLKIIPNLCSLDIDTFRGRVSIFKIFAF